MSEVTGVEGLFLFNKYSYQGLEFPDISLAPYISTKPLIVPHTANRNSNVQFGKAKTNIVERFVSQLMRRGRNNGKKRLAIKVIESAFFIIHELTKENPLQVLINAISNSSPREDSARIGRGGNMKRVSVDVSPSKRVSLSLKFLADGPRNSSMKNIKTISELIAEELINASKLSQNSYAVKKRDEIERIAKSNR